MEVAKQRFQFPVHPGTRKLPGQFVRLADISRSWCWWEPRRSCSSIPQGFEEVVLRVEIGGEPIVRLPFLIGCSREIRLHPFRYLTVVERQHIGTWCGPLGEVGGKVKPEPGPQRNWNAIGIGRQLMPGLFGGFVEFGSVLGVSEQDLQNLVFRQTVPGCGQITQHATDQQRTVVGRLAQPVEELSEKRGDALTWHRCRVVGVPELDLLEEQLQVDRLAAGRRCKALLDLCPLIITDLAARLGEPPVEKQQASFGLRENVQVDEVLGRGFGGA